jgi:ribonuclease P protein component
MIGRLLRKSDFERLLAVPACSRSAHFAAHHVRGGPGTTEKSVPKADTNELSTDLSTAQQRAVDGLLAGLWLGCVIPKRHAARSVTRNMLRRQIRAAVQRHHESLQTGLWLVRLRRPFAIAAFRSADSAALRGAAALELDRLLAQAAA